MDIAGPLFKGIGKEVVNGIHDVPVIRWEIPGLLELYILLEIAEVDGRP